MDIVLIAGDIFIDEKGDIILADSIAQKVRIKLLWFFEEWKWKKEEGIDYLNLVYIKNPNLNDIESAIREKIFEVNEITDVKDVSVHFDLSKRKIKISYIAMTDEETIREEVDINGRIWSN